MKKGSGKIFCDTAPFIYCIEENDEYYHVVRNFFLENVEADLVTSAITVGEYLTMPYRTGKIEYAKAFYKMIEDMDVELIDVSREIADEAARIRAEYEGFKLMDAIQLAAAVREGCNLFLTNDKQLRQFKEIEVVIVSDMTS